MAAVLTSGLGLSFLGLSFLPLILVLRLGGPVRHRRFSQLPSVGEVYALLVPGFQIGFAVDLLGFQQVERVEAGVLAPADD